MMTKSREKMNLEDALSNGSGSNSPSKRLSVRQDNLDSRSIQVLRIALLQAADAALPFDMAIAGYELHARTIVPNASPRDIERELQYLLDKGLLVDVTKAISPENRCYRIHANGRDFLAEHRLC
jgi:hypothetical protein